MEIQASNGKNIEIKNSDNKKVNINYEEKIVKIEDLWIDFPWEYEKAWILLEVKEFEERLYYSFLIESKTVVVIFDENFELKEEISSFFWDVDILLINGGKNSNKIIENIEARIVIPFWEWKDLCLNTLGQHIEEIENYKLKALDLDWNETQFVNLKM